MRKHPRTLSPCVVPGGVITLLLCLLAFSPGCAPKAQSRTEAQQKFLAPTNLDKLTPEARAQLSRVGKAPPAKR